MPPITPGQNLEITGILAALGALIVGACWAFWQVFTKMKTSASLPANVAARSDTWMKRDEVEEVINRCMTEHALRCPNVTRIDARLVAMQTGVQQMHDSNIAAIGGLSTRIDHLILALSKPKQ